jgi:signal transduction histidine kinase
MRGRIVMLAVLASSLTIALFGLPLAVALGQYEFADEQARLEQQANSVTTEVARDLAEGHAPTRRVYVRPQTQVAVYDSDRDMVYGSGPPHIGPEVAQAFSGRVGHGHHDSEIIAAVPVTDGEHLVGVVRAASPQRSLYLRLGWTWAAMAGLGVVAVGLVGLVARRQARRLAAPLVAVAERARRLGDGDFSTRFSAVAIPEIDAVGQALNTTAGRLDELLARERAFSAEASHQLRTPLAGLRLRLEAALHTPSRDLRSAVQDALGDADRVEQTIDELIGLARHHTPSGRRPLALAVLLEEAQRGWADRPGATGRDLRLEVEPDLPQSSASTAAIRQVLRVLLDNASVHGAGTVTVTAREVGEAVAIDVADQGRGIATTEARLFARRAPHPSGHGIGLALARRLAEAEGGRLRLSQPAPPVFTLLIPALHD